jgi:peroxiredoxin Q/BCP
MSKKTLKKAPKKMPRKALGKSARIASGKPKSKATVKPATVKGRPAAAKKPAKSAGNPAVTRPLEGKADASSGRTSALTEGAKALAGYSGQKLVLFFYPRADTPGCTREAIDFTRLKSAFAQSQTAILGVSADPPSAQEAFRDKHALSVALLSDEQHGMLEAYGVWGEKSMYGRTFQGVVRTTVLIGPDSRVLRIWRNVKVDGHADEVLAATRSF